MLFLFLIIFDRQSLKINLKDLWIFIGSGILGVFMLNMCYNEAAFRVSLSLASLLLSLAPIFALIISAILFKEEITKIKLACLVVALFGSFLVSGYFDGGSTVFSPFGILCGFLSALFWALFGMFSKIASNRGYSSFTITFYSFLIISIAIIPFADPFCWSAALHIIQHQLVPYRQWAGYNTLQRRRAFICNSFRSLDLQ